MTVKAVETSRQSTGRAPRHAAASVRRRLGGHLAGLALVAVLVPLHRWWAAQLLLITLLLILPGIILLRALRVPGRAVSSFPVYVPCASIVVLFASGLAVDMVGPLVGVATPLRTLPLLVGFEVTCLALLAASANVPEDVTIQWPSISRPARLAWPLVLPLVAAAGALRLNSGHGGAVALVGAWAIATLLVAVAVFSARLDDALLGVVLYAAGLATVWSYSLRGEPLYGFDIATEYQRLQQTIATGVWHTAHPNDAYGAMLSLTVMPAELHALSGIPGLLLFKVVYPAIYALFPVAIYCLARRILSRSWAFVVVAFTIGQYFFLEMAGFARQEIALVFFAALIAAILDSGIQRRTKWYLVALLGVATALSHYSTTYVAITVIGLSLPLQFATSWFRDVPRVTGAMVVGFIAVFAGAVIWYGPVTQSDSHVFEVAQTVEAQGLDLLPNRVPGGGLLGAYLKGNTMTPISATRYQGLISAYYHANEPFIKPFPGVSAPQYALRDSPVPEPPVRWPAGADTLGISLLIIEQLANVLAAFGALLMILRRGASVLDRQIGVLALATTLLLTLLRFSGTLAIAYGQERAQLQGLVVLAIALGWTIQRFAGSRKERRARVLAVAAACLAVVFFNTTFLIGAVLGGQSSVNLANSGPGYEYFYITAPEIASAEWLGKAVRPGQLVYADEYGQLPLATVTRIQQGLFVDLTPQTLNQHAWIYASRTNVINGRAFALYNNHLATYSFPADFIHTHYNLVYTDGSSEVFHR